MKFIDSNVLIYAVDDTDIEKQRVARGLVRHEHPPDAILAVPEVPVGVPAEPLPAGLAVADVDEVLVGITANSRLNIKTMTNKANDQAQHYQ